MDSMPEGVSERRKILNVVADYQRLREEADDIAEKTRITQELDSYLSSVASDPVNRYVTDLIFYGGNENRIMPKEWFNETKLLPFEDENIAVPIEAEKVLKRCFGEYMTPILTFDAHGYPFYEKNKKRLKDLFEFAFLEFSCSYEEYKDVMSGSLKKAALSEMLKSAIRVLLDMHDDAKRTDDPDGIKDILTQCQQIALEVGTEIEKRAIESSKVVENLEQYCEKIYEVYESVNSEDGLSDEVINGLSCSESMISKISDCEMEEKREVLFLCMSPKDWESMHDIWKHEVSDPKNHVAVIAIPYKDKDSMGLISDGDWVVESHEYPDEIKETICVEYDLEYMRPDVIYHNSPYDEFSDGYTVHPYYYTKNLRKYCDELVFVMPYNLREIVDEDSRSRYTLGTYICNPGVVFSDRVIVKTENTAKVCDEILIKKFPFLEGKQVIQLANFSDI